MIIYNIKTNDNKLSELTEEYYEEFCKNCINIKMIDNLTRYLECKKYEHTTLVRKDCMVICADFKLKDK